LERKKPREKRPALGPDFVGVNPFVGNLVIRVRKVETGTYEAGKDGILMPKEIEFEYDQQYRSYVSRDIRILLMGLKHRSLQLWMWMMQSIDYGEDVVWVDVLRYKRECEIRDDKTYRAAVIELSQAGFISACAGVKNAFFINPAMGFKGSRINKYPNNIEFK
jgi:hypothetical protein